MGILFYILGLVTGSSLIGFIIYRKKYNDSHILSISLLDRNASLLKYKDDRESKKRRCKYKTTGWHKSNETNNPNKKTWNVFYELKEVEYSEDEKKTRFDVVNVFSEGTYNGDDGWGISDYTNWFTTNTGGGWLDVDKQVSNGKLEWITKLSKSDIRDDKLDQLLSND